MPTPVILIDAKTGKALDTQDFGDFGVILTVADPLRIRGVSKTTKILASGGATQTIVLANTKADGSIVLTDLIISFEKKQSAEVTIQWNCGTNTELIWFMDMSDAPISLAIGFSGRWQGWSDAHIEVGIAGAGLDGSVGVGYVHVSKENSLSYSEWDERR